METLPDVDSPAIEELSLTLEERDAYWDVLEQMNEEVSPGTQHQLLGYSSPIQADMQLECQLVSNGLYCGDATGYEDPRAQALRSGARRWELLMQIDSDDEADMMWGDCGRLYFWLPMDALQRRAFDESWMVLQCA